MSVTAEHTAWHLCPRGHGLWKSQVQGAGKAGSGCQALAPAPASVHSASSAGQLSRLQRGVRSKLGGRAGLGCLKLRRENKRRPLWAGLAGARGGTEGGKGRLRGEGCGEQGKVRAPWAASRCGPLHKEAPEAGEGWGLAGGTGWHTAAPCVCQKPKGVSQESMHFRTFVPLFLHSATKNEHPVWARQLGAWGASREPGQQRASPG